MATELAQKPINFFQDNKASIFAPKEDVAMNQMPTLNARSLSADFGAATGAKPADNQNTMNLNAGVVGLTTKPAVGTIDHVEAANTAAITLHEPGPVKLESSVGIIGGAAATMAIEAGGQAMKYGSELTSKLFSLFGAGGDDNEQNVADKENEQDFKRAAPATQMSGMSPTSGPSMG